MTPEYNRFFKENLLAFTKAIHNQEKEYTAFYPIIGKHYAQKNHLLVVGQVALIFLQLQVAIRINIKVVECLNLMVLLQN